MVEMLGGCCVCSDDRGWPENPLVYCDGQGCNVAVHQACYGIVTVPSGPWFCRKCELRERPSCELCPSKEGAFKKTDSNSWAHVVCALYIPEVRFGNVTTMEPILISLIPTERFNRTCYICEENQGTRGKASAGACMQCNKSGCRSTFHVTCAQMLGLLCEEAGNMMDNVKYCGYCQHHYGKLKATRHVKIIPPYRPVPANNSRSVSPASSVEKSAHPQSKAATGSSSADDANGNGKSGAAGSTSTSSQHVVGPGSTPQNSSGEGGKSTQNISPDINSVLASKTATNNKNMKKTGGYHHSHSTSAGTGSKSSASNSMIDSSKLAAAGGGVSSTQHDKADVKAKGHGKPESDHHQSSLPRCEDSQAVKLERLEDRSTASKTSGLCPKKDFSTIQLKEVVTAALDRPITNSPGSKFDHTSSLTSGLEGPSSLTSQTSTSTTSSGIHGGRHSHSHGHPSKIAPPDIKPDVTLTPIPMKPSSSSSSRHGSGGSKDDDREFDSHGSKTPGANLSFHHSFGAPPKLLNQQVSPDISEASTSKGKNPPELVAQDEIADKTSGGPPTKRARGMSRDEDREREQRRTPTKGRGGGRRGSTTGSGYSRRECRNDGNIGSSAVAYIDDSSFDEVIEANGSTTNGSTETSSRGGRQSSSRKSNVNTRSNKTSDDSAPTLSMLKQSGQLGSETPPAGLAPHMFGNALNPSSSMAMKMVDTLSEEMEAVAAAGGTPEVVPTKTPLVGIPGPSTKASASPAANVTATGNSPTGSAASTSTSAAGAQVPPQTLEQLLERQWEQGSQFLMEQAQHLDIAQLLSCLNQLKQDNKALEEHVQSLIQRRDQLTAINARLSVPLGSSSTLTSLGGAFSGGGTGAGIGTVAGAGTGPGPSANSHHNGYAMNSGAPSPNVHAHPHPHAHPPSGQGSKNHPVANSTPSPQQQHQHQPHSDHLGQHQHQPHHHSRERNPYSMNHNHELPGGRAELVVTHSSMHPGHQNHAASHGGSHRSQSQLMASHTSYNSYGSHPVPVVTSLTSSHSHPHQQPHSSSRDER